MLRQEGKDMDSMSEDELAAWILKKSMGDKNMSNFEEAEIYKLLQHFANKKQKNSKSAEELSGYELYQQFKESQKENSLLTEKEIDFYTDWLKQRGNNDEWGSFGTTKQAH